MNVVLWIIAGILAIALAMADLLKISRPKDKLAANMAWVEDFSPGTIEFIAPWKAWEPSVSSCPRSPVSPRF